MKNAILVKNSDTFDGGWVKCPDCSALFFVSFATVDRTSCDHVCVCGVLLTVPIFRDVIVDAADHAYRLLGDRIMKPKEVEDWDRDRLSEREERNGG